MNWLKQSTAATVKLGPFVDTDGAATTGLTISQADIRLSKNGGAFAQTNNATGATHDENGYYGIPLDTTDTGTLGRLRVAVAESGALAVWADFMVLPAAVYDSLVLGTDTLPADVTQWNGTNVAAPATAGYPVATLKVGTGTGELNASSGKVPATIAAGDIAADAVSAASVSAAAVTKIQSGLALEASLQGLITTVGVAGAGLTAAGGSVVVSPVVGVVSSRVEDTDITLYIGETIPTSVTIVDTDGDAVDLSGLGDLVVCIESSDAVDLQVIEHASLTISGASNNVLTFTNSSDVTATRKNLQWSLRVASTGRVIAKGRVDVQSAPLEDA